MLLFGIFEDERVTLEVSPGMKVRDFKKVIQEKLNISDDLCKFDKTVISLTYARAELQDSWILSDLGIVPGTTIRIQLKEEDNPVLYIKCSHNNETLTIFDNLNVGSMSVKELKSLASKRTGLPVGVFRLCTNTGRELFDCHNLDEYGIEAGNTLKLENWDGLNDFFNLAIRGFTEQVKDQINLDELQGRYLLRVALHIASHFGHVDLARSLLKMGGRPDEPVGEPPQRQWCKGLSHVDTLKAPVHVATEMGQLGILRLFVNNDITCLIAEDGEGLMPMNIALRKRIQNSASYLLSKQWTKVNLTKTVLISVKLYGSLKKWCDRAREQVYMKLGGSKSSLKNRFVETGPLVSHGVLVDGFSKSEMNGKPKAQVNRDERKKAKEILVPFLDENEEDADFYFRNTGVMDRPTDRSLITDRKLLFNVKSDVPRNPFNPANSRLAWKENRSRMEGRGSPSRASSTSTPDNSKKDSESLSPERDRGTKLPPILERNRQKIVSQSQPALNISPKGSVRLGKGGFKRLVKKQSMKNLKQTKTITQSLPNVNMIPPESNLGGSVPSMSVPSTQRSEKSRTNPSSYESRSSTIDDPERQDSEYVPDEPKRTKNPRGKKSKITNPHASDAPIPLPLISSEQTARPFFYLNGLREEDVIDPTIELLSKYKGGSQRERAIQSLVIANNFKEKPWLSQIRMALSLSTTAIKRDVKRRKSKRKDRSVQCSLTPVQQQS